MLSFAEQDLVRRDIDLPGLSTLLDAAAFRATMQDSAQVQIEGARLDYLRYKPGQNCIAAYTLKVAGAEVLCHAKAYRQRDGAKLVKAGLRPAVSGLLGSGRLIWPRTNIEVCVFPNDNKLGSLSLVGDPVRREDLLRRHLPDHEELWRSEVRTLAYKPERRWAGALEVNMSPLAVCKMYGGSAFEVARIKSKCFRNGDVLRLAPLIGRSKGRAALFYGWQRGELLSQAMLAPTFDPAVMFRVGVALAELQQQGVTKLPERLATDQARALVELGKFLEFLLPAEAERIRDIATGLAASIASLPREITTVHGDFYAKQILFSGEEITLLDLDEAARGDEADDLGTFLAHLEREVAAERLSEARRDAFRAELLAGHASKRGETSMARVELYTAVRLFARLPDFFRHHDSDWPRRTKEMLARVESLVRKPNPVVSIRLIADAKLPALEQAMDLEVAGGLLASALRASDAGVRTVVLQQTILLRHKPGRRALIEYQLELQRSGIIERMVLLGKVSRRGVDMENLEMVRELSTGNFNAASADGISVPEQYGAISELGMTLQRRVEGHSLAVLLRCRDSFLAARRAGDAICKLHHSELMLAKTHTISDELDILKHRLMVVSARRPEWEDRIARLFQACQRLAMGLQSVSPRPIHRDFYHDQLMLDGNRVWLLDLDLLCAGDPALDAGNFIGHLIEWGVRDSVARPALDAGNFIGHLIEWGVRDSVARPALTEAAQAFAERFQQLSGGGSLEAVELYTTLTLARHVSISRQFPDRAPFTEAILELCEQRCGLTDNSIRHTTLAESTL